MLGSLSVQLWPEMISCRICTIYLDNKGSWHNNVIIFNDKAVDVYIIPYFYEDKGLEYR